MVDAMREMASQDGHGRLVAFSHYLTSVHHNALGQHVQALGSAKLVMDWSAFGYRTLAAPELAEAASRRGDTEVLAAVTDWTTARAAATPTDWALGVSALVGALAADEPDAADVLYRTAVERLDRTQLPLPLARAQLLYGEWLRRRGRKADALKRLTAAHDDLTEMGLHSFAQRAQCEMAAMTERRVRRFVDDPTARLTAQEFQVVELARDGLTNRGNRRAPLPQRSNGRVAPAQRLRKGRCLHATAAPRRRLDSVPIRRDPPGRVRAIDPDQPGRLRDSICPACGPHVAAEAVPFLGY